MALGRVLGAALLWYGVIGGLTNGAAAVAKTPRKLQGKFLHITDLHPDQFYRAHSSTDEAEACHRGKGPAGTYGAETSDCDSPFALINATFDWIEANLRDQVDFVVWTGDSARHDSDEDIPRSQDQVLGTNRYVADKFAELFTSDKGHGLGVPVVPTLGNNDILPHNILLSGPNQWLQHYTHLWRHFIPEAQRHSFEFGGWFYTEVVPDRLAVFSLNTLYFFDRNAGVDGCATSSEPGYKQLEWLRVQLQFMRERGMKAILMGHVPPARTDSKRLWDETCWQKYTLWLQQFRDVVVAGVYGHMNIDHFMLQDSHNIDFGLLAGGAASGMELDTREAMEDELSVESATDYLQELRSDWAKLTPPAVSGKPGNVKGDKSKGRKGRKKKDPWGERYQLTLVGPSVVPNYFPTLRVIEYNISGLENAPVWAARKGSISAPVEAESEQTQKHLDLRDVEELDDEFEAEGGDNSDANKRRKKKHKKKPKKGKKPKGPGFAIPDPPAKTAPPGPAYSMQPLSLTGYTQYFANLTYINNVTLETNIGTSESESQTWVDWLLHWRHGKHGGKSPAAPEPRPREFYYEVEYSTFEDKVYKLRDLTVNSFVDLAYRMGQKAKGSGLGDFEAEEEFESDDNDDDDDDDEDSDEEEDGDVEAEGKKGKKHKGGKDKDRKKKKKKSKKKKNKAWLHFLRHAFVCTVEPEELTKFG